MPDAALITAFATFLTAVTLLVKTFQADGVRTQQSSTLGSIKTQTNGTLAAILAQNAQLAATQATDEELAARPTHTSTTPPGPA